MHIKVFLFSAVTAVAATGCEPSCQKTCAKLIECENIDTPRLHEEECARSCGTQQNLYDTWEASDERERFADMKRCISDAECSDIEDGECYAEELYIW